jgi:hypothetical protein
VISLRRLFVIGLLLLALPLQALASAAMLHGQGGGPGGLEWATATVDESASATHETAPCHQDEPAGPCSECADCCLALVLTRQAAAPAALGPQAAPVAAPRPDPASAPQARLERPPRTLHTGRA